jgi:hypothetical protein
MSTNVNKVVRWRVALALFVVDVVTFVLSNATTKGKSGQKIYPGTVSNVFWVLFLIGVLLLIVLGIVALFKWLRSRKPSPAVPLGNWSSCWPAKLREA